MPGVIYATPGGVSPAPNAKLRSEIIPNAQKNEKARRSDFRS
jgi:hypothetical protein